jgi:hypothetical protein
MPQQTPAQPFSPYSNDIIDLAGEVTGNMTPETDVASLVELAGKVTDEAADYDAKIVANFTAIQDMVGVKNVTLKRGGGDRLLGIDVRAPKAQRDEIQKALGRMFGEENVYQGADTGIISVTGGTDIAMRRLGKATRALSAYIARHAEGTIGGLSRLGAKTKLTPAGTRSFLEHQFGEENVWPVNDQLGNYFVKTGGKWRWLDQPKGELLDVVDVIPEATEAAIGTAGAAAGAVIGARHGAPRVGAAVGGAIGDAGASLARQGVSGLLPGEDFPEGGLSEAAKRLELVGGNVAGGLAPEALMGLARYANPVSAIGKAAAKELITETTADVLAKGGRKAGTIAEERLALGAKHGVDLSLGEATGSPTISRIEGLLSDRPLTADTMQLFRRRRIAQLAKAVEREIERTSGGNVGAHESSRRLANSYGELVSQMFAERSDVAQQMYKRASDLAGGAKVVSTDEVTSVIKQIAKEQDIPLRPAGSRNLAESLMAQIEGGLGKLDIDTFQRMRSLWGKAARGEATIFEGLSPKEQTTIAKRIFGALNRDMEATIAASEAKPFVDAAGQMTSQPAQMARAIDALKEANDVYKLMSEKIEATRNVILEKATGLKAIEGDAKLPAFILSTGTTVKQVGDMVGIMSRADRTAVAKLRGAVLGEIVDKASKAAPAGSDISVAALSKGLRGNMEKLRMLYKGDMGGFKAVQELAKLGDIVRDAPFQGGSKTYGMFAFDKLLGAFANARWSPQLFLGEAGKLFTGKRLARILNDPTMAREFLQLVNPPPGKATQVVSNSLRIVGRLVKNLERDEALEQESQQ